MNILTINSGSTSIKFKLYRMPSEDEIASGRIENIGFDRSIISFKTRSGSGNLNDVHIADHRAGLNFIIDKLTNPKTGVIKDKKEIHAVGHRIVNVGDKVASHVIINDQMVETLRDCIDLAPLHNPPNLVGVEVSIDVFGKDTINTGIFDNIFHKNMPSHAFLYGIPYEYYEKYRIRKYGFHGIAYTYMVETGAAITGKDLKKIRIIVLMLGGGSSITAVKNGISIDTSMGFTPAEGLIMSTRSGDVDPAILPYLMNKEDIGTKEIDNIINKKSGILGLSRKYTDFVNIQKGVMENDPDCIRAFESYCYRIKKYIGAYAAVMDGVDLIIFGGGIGENSPMAREKILADLSVFGISIEKEINYNDSLGERLISSVSSKVPVCIVKVNEELIIARETYRLVKG
ncbi:MAG: acetate kinase [Actinobacteria bacterium]|nr:acetate kinase [Actinomycetota bacterium]MCL5072075.1 acetate kinase [Actinomycetota bacterium]